MTDPLRNLAPGATFDLPSVETMRREVETGEFSKESVDIANAMLREADKDDWWAGQEQFGAPLSPEEQAQVDEIHKDLKRNAQRKYAPKPSQIRPISRTMKELSEGAQKATTAFKEMGEKIGRVKKEYVPQPHLTHRPFRTPELEALRDHLRGLR